jgi:hypothetical protein
MDVFCLWSSFTWLIKLHFHLKRKVKCDSYMYLWILKLKFALVQIMHSFVPSNSYSSKGVLPAVVRRCVWFRNLVCEEPNINKLWLNLNRRYITGCISCMPLIVTVNTIAECPRTDCNIQGASERSPLFGKLINSKPKKIRQMFFLFLESTQNATLHQRVLSKTSLKLRPWILIHWCSLSR